MAARNVVHFHAESRDGRVLGSLLGALPQAHTLKTLGKLDHRSGGHSVMNRVAGWLACSGVERPVFDEDHSQCFTVEDSDQARVEERLNTSE